jgi:hypothetical protein
MEHEKEFIFLENTILFTSIVSHQSDKLSVPSRHLLPIYSYYFIIYFMAIALRYLL